MGTVPLRICRAVALILLFSLCLFPSPALAEANDGPYLLHLERGDSVQVLRMEPATFGMFRYVRIDSVKRYLPGNRVQSITDAIGRDVTHDVLRRRQGIGVDPLAYRPDAEYPRPAHRDRLTFPIVEVGVYGQVNDPSSTYDGPRWMTGLDFGVMRNVSRAVSVGGTIHLEVEDDRTGLGLAVRARRWLGNTVSVDGATGWIFAGDDERGDFLANAFYGEAAINLQDRLHLAARVESWRWAQLDYDAYGYQLEPRQETLLQLGGKVGVVPGVPIFIMFLLAAAADSRAIY